jgi:hypothetical protein
MPVTVAQSKFASVVTEQVGNPYNSTNTEVATEVKELKKVPQPAL